MLSNDKQQGAIRRRVRWENETKWKSQGETKRMWFLNRARIGIQRELLGVFD